jgi:hypothetical protein
MNARIGGMLWVVAVAFGTGCHVWRAVPLAPGTAQPLPARTRVVRPTGERIELAGARVTPDSVVGARARGAPYAAVGRVALARDSVAFLEVRRLSWGRTLGLAAGVYVGVGVVLGVLVAASGY